MRLFAGILIPEEMLTQEMLTHRGKLHRVCLLSHLKHVFDRLCIDRWLKDAFAILFEVVQKVVTGNLCSFRRQAKFSDETFALYMTI